MSSTTLSDYDPDEFSPVPALTFCCPSIQKLDIPVVDLPRASIQRHIHVHDQLFRQRGTIPTSDTHDLPLKHDSYNWGMLCIIAQGAGTIKSNKRWFAPTGPKNDCYFVFIPKHKVYQAQRNGQVDRKEEYANTCVFGNCPKHPGVVFSTKWFAFIGGEEDVEMSEEQAEQSIDTQGAIYEEGTEQLNEMPDPMSESEFEESSIQPASLSQPQSSQPTAPQASMSSAQLVQSTAGSNPYQSLRDRVKNGRGLPCDECSRLRHTCSRRMTPGGPPKCDDCEKRNVRCAWDTVGTGKRDARTLQKLNSN